MRTVSKCGDHEVSSFLILKPKTSFNKLYKFELLKK